MQVEDDEEQVLRLAGGELMLPEVAPSGSAAAKTAEATLGQVSLTLRCTPDHWGSGRKSAKKKARKVEPATLLVLVVDESGSMAGTFGRQVVPALTAIVGQSFELSHVETEVIVYNDRARRLSLTKDNYEQKLSVLRANGGTSFNSAFRQIGEVLEDRAKEFDDIVIGFLTDGQDDEGLDSRDYRALRKAIRSSGKNVVVHALAFTSFHDFEFLNTIRRDLGTVEGGFQYAEPTDGPEALKDKMQAIFDTVARKRATVKLVITIRRLRFVSEDEEDDVVKKRFKRTVSIPTSGAAVDIFSLLRVKSDAVTVPLNSPVEVKVVASLPGTTADRITETFTLTARPLDASAAARTGLRRVGKRVDALHATIAGTATNGTVDKGLTREWLAAAKELTEQMKRYQGVAMLQLFKKQQRAQVFDEVSKINDKLNQIHTLLADLSINASLSTAMKARLAEIAYGHQFQSATRTLRLHKRAGNNAEVMAKAEQELRLVEIDKEAVGSVSDELAENFHCVLTQSTWKELLLQDDADERDVLGFGIALSRPETAVDDPTQVRIMDISVTPVAKIAFEDALKYSISTKGHIESHGGFAHGEGDTGTAMRGMGREPINAWVPLFINAQHWKLVLPQIKGIMGYLATLNPLGYNPNQLDLFYLILGTMVARLKSTPGEKELGLIFAMQRTCIALTQDFPGAVKKLKKLLQAFVAKPAHRLKDKTKNLLVLLGYVLSLPLDVVQSVIGSDADWHTFWLHILNESLRRAMEAVHGRTAKEDINALLDSITHPTSSPLSLEDVASHPFTSLTCPYSSGGGAATFRNGKQRGKKDAMELSSSDDESEGSNGGGATFGLSRGRGGGTRGGRGGFGSLVLPLRGRGGSVVVRGRGATMRGGATVGPSGRQNRTASASVTATTTTTTPTPQPFVARPEQDGRVKRWVEQVIAHGDEEATLPDLVDADEAAALDVKIVTREMLDVLLQLGQSFNHHGHPSLSALISLATFTHSWLDLQRHAGGTQVMLHDIDSNGGVAPNSWIVATKQAFKDRSAQPATLASCFEVLARATSKADKPVSSQHGSDWLVTMRAMAVQALRLKVNKECREAIQKGDYLDPVTQARQVLAKSTAELLASKEKDTKQQQRNDQFRYAIHRCLTTDDMTTFVGYLMSKQGFGGKRNSQAFKELYMKFQHVDMAKEIPLGAEKLQVLLTGQWCGDAHGTTINVLDGGQAWQPGIRRSKKKYRNNSRRFERVWGPLPTTPK